MRLNKISKQEMDKLYPSLKRVRKRSVDDIYEGRRYEDEREVKKAMECVRSSDSSH